ncbi:hypothetical protein BS47DRAFT_513976 [Hydnum rufescens UP504]|uniref:Uncharacterized protein n=1 Tax=Hydnum rufescens UP504 TaxID=1448309 RepID=A0A9P6DNY4_9AGAM|nr:hypothetical protein BS47DRAFT_513976 [Hydnum rufescens UP504]
MATFRLLSALVTCNPHIALNQGIGGEGGGPTSKVAAVRGELPFVPSPAVTLDASEQISDGVSPQNHAPTNQLGFRNRVHQTKLGKAGALIFDPYLKAASGEVGHASQKKNKNENEQ